MAGHDGGYGNKMPPPACMATEKCLSWCDAVDACKKSDFRSWSWGGAKCAAPGDICQDMTVYVARTVIKNSHRRVSADSGKRHVVRFKGVPKVTYDLAGKGRNVTKPAGDVKLLRDFHDTPAHELNALIALRDAKALAMSLGIHCRFEWPVLWRKDDAIICSTPPGGPKKDFIGKGIMPIMRPRSDAIKELDAS